MTTTAVDNNIVARVADRLARSVGPRRYAMWFDQSARFDYDADHRHTYVLVPNQFVADWIERNFHPQLRAAVDHVVAPEAPMSITVAPERFHSQGLSPANGDDASPGTTAAATESTHRRAATSRPAESSMPAMRHRLDDFVVGPSNELAFAAAAKLADGQPDAAHPLFIHGGCGLGKTHLLQGICHQFHQHQPSARILYTTGERFTNEYITAVRNNKLDTFRRKMRRLDLLAVDDVHFIANKQATQQEFLHSFDEIELGGARLILASDSHPKLIKQFSDALVSRCVRGLVVQIHTPDTETRRRLIAALAQRRHIHLAGHVLDLLAGRCDGSVREIEGTLTKLQALTCLTQRNDATAPIGRAMIERLFDDDRARQWQTPVRFDDVIAAVSEHLGVTASQITGRGRHRHIVLARSMTIYLARQLTSMSYPEIAAAMDRGNHSTIITAAQRMARQLQANQPVLLPSHASAVTPVELVERVRRAIERR